MENNEKTHHHFVPQVYLRKFAHTTDGDRDIVAIYDKIDNRFDDLPTKEICTKKKLYTIDADTKEKRETIENFYANKIESDYNTFYDIITDDSKIIISNYERELIISTVTNLHLRNYYWLKSFNEAWSYFIRSADRGTKTNVYDENGKILFPFSEMDVDKIISKEKANTKQAFIQTHLMQSLEWFNIHFYDIIMVDKIGGLITSDRPVISLNKLDSLRIPIDNDYLLTLMPRQEGLDFKNHQITRNNPFLDSKVFNLMQYDSCMRMIIAKDKELLKQTNDNYKKATYR